MIKSAIYTGIIMAALMASCDPTAASEGCSRYWAAGEFPAWLECRQEWRTELFSNPYEFDLLHRTIEDLESDIDTLQDTLEDIEYEHRNHR